ncbi:MAG: TlpA disulfide reductase family protein [Bacteroidota bacterium]|nr:TlpA disulfide reductase family protein [Bacteroidota bacterium]
MRLKWLSISVILLVCVLFNVQAGNGKKKKPAIEFNAISLKGDSVRLSNFKGKYVLLDFWASWCIPCRKTNPELVKLYRNFHDKKYLSADNFEIISISMDREVNECKNAIEEDNLYWKYQLCDGLGSDGQISKDYKVAFIPTEILIDPEGNILGKNLRIDEIEDLLNNQKQP